MERSSLSGRVWRFVVPWVLLGLVVWWVDLSTLGRYLLGADPIWLVAGLLVVQVQVVASALRWRYTVIRLGRRLSIPRVVREYYLASLLNQVLPGGVTGDAARIARNRHAGGTGAVAHGVIIERLSGQLALALVTAAGLLVWPWFAHDEWPAEATTAVRGLFAVLACTTVVVAFLVRFGPRAWRAWLVAFGPAIRRTWWDDGAWRVQTVASLSIVGTYLLAFAISGYAIGQPLPWLAVPIVVPLVLFTMLIPVSVGGWGVRELAAAALWPVVGLSAEAGVATSVVYGLLSLVGTLPGALVPVADRAAT